MNEKTLSCPKCGASMAPGFIREKDYDARDKPSEWISSGVKSVIKASLIEGKTNIKANLIGGKAKGQAYLITTYRCRRCGFLESYAGG